MASDSRTRSSDYEFTGSSQFDEHACGGGQFPGRPSRAQLLGSTHNRGSWHLTQEAIEDEQAVTEAHNTGRSVTVLGGSPRRRSDGHLHGCRCAG